MNPEELLRHGLHPHDSTANEPPSPEDVERIVARVRAAASADRRACSLMASAVVAADCAISARKEYSGTDNPPDLMSKTMARLCAANRAVAIVQTELHAGWMAILRDVAGAEQDIADSKAAQP